VSSAIEAEADVLCAGEVRYHDALDAVARGLAIVEVGHDVSEWPLVSVLADAVKAAKGLAEEMVRVDRPAAAWWTTDGGSHD
jgi:putative NIF3 family GTP cyclohydrolase 1 type 2